MCYAFGAIQAASASPLARLQQALDLAEQGKIASALNVIGRPQTAAPMTPEEGRAAFLYAMLQQEQRGGEAARSAFEIVWLSYPPLADYAVHALAKAAAARGDDARLRELVDALSQRYPYSLHLPSVRLLLAQTQRRLGHRQQAFDTVARVLQTSPTHDVIPEALVLRAKLEEEAGQIAKAALTFKRMGDAYPRHAQAASAFKRSRQLLKRLPAAQRPHLNPEDELNALDNLMQARRWGEMQQRFTELAPLMRNHPRQPHFLLLQAIVAQRRRRLSQAMTLLQRLLIHYPNSPERAEAHYRLAQLYRRKGRRDQRETHLRHAMAQRRDAEWAPKAALKLARIFESQNDLDQASDLYRQVGEHHPEHKEAGPSLWQAAWLQYRQGRYDQAEQIWRRLAKQAPQGVWQPQVLYWLARAVEQRGASSNAQALYQRVMTDFPYTYYGYQARRQLRRFSAPIPAFAAQEQPYLPWERRSPVTLTAPLIAEPSREQFHLIRARELQTLRMRREARQEIYALETSLPSSHAAQYLIAGLLADNQDHLAALRRLNPIVDALTPLQTRALTRDFWALLYPTRFLDTVTRQAAKYEVSPYLILSLIRQESVFNPRAVSRVGARGLMQLMPATARRVARRTGRKRLRLPQLYDPQINIAMGTHYFAAQLRRFDNNPAFALAAYNAGPHRVDTWRQRWPNLPMDEFVEHIPFEETRLYVKLVLRNLSIYEALHHPMPDA